VGAGCAGRGSDQAKVHSSPHGLWRVHLSDPHLALNAIKAWSRDAAPDVAHVIDKRVMDPDFKVLATLRAFITDNSTRTFQLQPPLSLQRAPADPFPSRNNNLACQESISLFSSWLTGHGVCMLSCFHSRGWCCVHLSY
jgi:hypothetical protein